MLAFIALIIKNIWRQKARTILTIFGISLGIATIVSLGVITEGLKGSMEKIIKTGDADFMVAQANVADLTYSAVTTEQIKKIKKIKGVKQAVGLLLGVAQSPKNPYFILFGLDRGDAKLAGISLTTGRLFKNGSNELIIGKMAAKHLDLKVNNRIRLRDNDFRVVGIFETGNAFQDGGGFLSLKTLQDQEQKKDQVTMVLVKADNNIKDVGKLAKKVERAFKGKLATISSVSEYSAIDQGLEITNFTGQAISILAVVIGGIGVMNTIMMSVFERTREIGILRAVGWKKRRVLMMILGESLTLGVFSIGVGIGLGLAAVEYVMSYPIAQSFLTPSYPWAVFQRAIVVGILVSFVGALYPAWRATRFSPAEALRYE